MNASWMERTQLLIKEQGLERLIKAHVLIVGLGGVGSDRKSTRLNSSH